MTLDSYLVGCSCLTDEETEPIKGSHRQWLAFGNSGLGLLVSDVSVLSSTQCCENLGHLFCHSHPQCSQKMYIWSLLWQMPNVFPLLQLHRDVFRDCDLDAIVWLRSRAIKAWRLVLGAKRYYGIKIQFHTKLQLCDIYEFEYKLILFNRKNVQCYLWYMICVCICHNCDPNKTLIMIHMHRVEI